MTVQLERSFELPVSAPEVWAVISDPAIRAEAISVVRNYSVDPTNDHKMTWHVLLPIPFLRQTVRVETEDVERNPPTYIKFVGTSRFLDVTGEHELVETNGSCRITNRFTVTGAVPGVESFFKRNLDGELDNLYNVLVQELGLEQ